MKLASPLGEAQTYMKLVVVRVKVKLRHMRLVAVRVRVRDRLYLHCMRLGPTKRHLFQKDTLLKLNYLKKYL